MAMHIPMTNHFRPKTLPDGRAMLNLACGTKMHHAWTNIDFSPYAFLAHHRYITWFLRQSRFLSRIRSERLQRVDPDIIRWNILKGIPFAESTFDVVYHSHFLEHLERSYVLQFLEQCYGVLKSNGLMRVVVPDLQILATEYILSCSALQSAIQGALSSHHKAIHNLFDQMVRTEQVGTFEQDNWVRFIERLIRGGPKKVGELHRWMYDQFSLEALIKSAGFKEIRKESFNISRISSWNDFALDIDEKGDPYKPGSLFM